MWDKGQNLRICHPGQIMDRNGGRGSEREGKACKKKGSVGNRKERVMCGETDVGDGNNVTRRARVSKEKDSPPRPSPTPTQRKSIMISTKG